MATDEPATDSEIPDDVGSTELSLQPETTLVLPEDVEPAEAAAIAVSIGAHLRDLETAVEEADSPAWEGKRWAYAGRLASITGRPSRVPHTAPPDAWSASGRQDRF